MTTRRTSTSPALLMLAALLAAWIQAPAAAAAGAGPAPSDAGEQQITDMRGTGALDPLEARRLRFLFWAYTAIWLLMAAYLVRLGVGLRGVRDEIRRLRDSAGGAAGRSGSG